MSAHNTEETALISSKSLTWKNLVKRDCKYLLLGFFWFMLWCGVTMTYDVCKVQSTVNKPEEFWLLVNLCILFCDRRDKIRDKKCQCLRSL